MFLNSVIIKVLAPWKLLTCIPLYVELHAVKLCMPVLLMFIMLFIFCITAGAPWRKVLRTDGVLLGKYDIINNK